MTALKILHDLTPTAEALLERHLDTTKEWFPHHYVPYSRGRDFTPGEAWSADDADLDAPLDDAVRSALYVNLLTEDNLPYYFRSVERIFGRDGAWGEWVRRWTAEEGRHSMAIYGYLMTTRAVDPEHLERGRMAQVSGGETPDPPNPCEAFVYLSLQELATRIAHRNTGARIGDERGHELMRRVAMDENLHYLFYRDLATAALEMAPSDMMRAIREQVVGFAMPGTGIPGYSSHAKAIANAQIYDLAIHHTNILEPVVVRHWGLEHLEGLDAEAERARDEVLAYIAKSRRVADRLAERRESTAALATTE